MKKRLIWAIIGLVAIIVLIIILLSIKTPTQVILEDGMTLDNEACAKVEGVSNTKVMVLHQLGCPHCVIVLPILREIEQEQNKTFSYYDLAIETDRKKVLDEMNILPKGVPAVIANCKVYVGQRTKEEYLEVV